MMNNAISPPNSIRNAALPGVPDDGVVHADQLAKDPLVIRIAKVVPDGEGTAVWWMGDDRITFQVLSQDTDGAYAFWVDEPEPQEGPPKHVHSREEEGFYVLSGEATFQAGHVRAAIGPGSFIALPVGVPHKWVNTSKQRAKLITFTAPGGNEGFFLALGEPGEGPAKPKKTMAVTEINKHTPRFGATYMETTDNPMDGALIIGAGRSPTIMMPGEGDARYSANCVYTIKASGAVTANTYTLMEIELRKGGVMPSHRHAAFEEGIYVLEGILAAELEGSRVTIEAGGFLNVPWGTKHEFKNLDSSNLRILSLSVPGGIEDYYRAACHVTAHESGDAATDVERMIEIGKRFGVF
jgi:quercetin dioxygenase-like cupin family protein